MTIGDRVFLDTNANGIQDSGETGIAGVTVKLLDSKGCEVANTTTDANGLYSFTTNPGTYKVQVVAPNGFSFSSSDQGSDDNLDSDVNASGQSGLITLSSGQNNHTIDAGLLSVDIAVEKTFLNLDEYLIDLDPEDANGDGDLEFETIQVAEPQQNDPISFQIKVTNNGQTKANTVKVTDLVDNRLLIDSITLDDPSALIANYSSGQNIDVCLSLNPGETRTITVTTQVNFSETDDLFPLDLQYNFSSDNPLLDEYHNVEVAGSIYTSAIGAVKNVGSTLITFNPFAPVENTASATLLDAGVVETNLSNNTGTDTFRFLRMFLRGTLNDGITPITILSLGAVEFDVDPLYSWPGRVYQNSKLLGPGDVGIIQGQTFWAVSERFDLSAFENATGTTAFDQFQELVTQGVYGIGQSEGQNPKNAAQTSSIMIERILDQGTPQPIPATQMLGVDSSGVTSTDIPIVSLIANSNLQAQLNAQPSHPILTGYSIIIPASGAVSNVFTTQLANLSTFFNNNNFIKEFVVETGVNTIVFRSNTTAASLDASSFDFVSNNAKLQIIFEGVNQKDSIIGTQRNDLMRGGNGEDELSGGKGNDTLEGGNGKDILNGEAGNDFLVGGTAQDILIGGSGNDTLKGESGADTFVFGINSGDDRVSDWDNTDKIDLTQFIEPDSISDLNTNTSGASANRIDASDAFVTLQSNNLLLNLTSFGGGTITFTNVTSISTSAFIF